MLLTAHNVHFYQDLMRSLQAAIEADRFDAVAHEWREGLARGDIEAL